MGLFSGDKKSSSNTSTVTNTTVVNKNTTVAGEEVDITADDESLVSAMGTLTAGADAYLEASSAVGQVALARGNNNGTIEMTDYNAMENAQILASSALDLVASNSGDMVEAAFNLSQPAIESSRDAEENIFIQYKYVAALALVAGFYFYSK